MYAYGLILHNNNGLFPRRERLPREGKRHKELCEKVLKVRARREGKAEIESELVSLSVESRAIADQILAETEETEEEIQNWDAFLNKGTVYDPYEYEEVFDTEEYDEVFEDPRYSYSPEDIDEARMDAALAFSRVVEAERKAKERRETIIKKRRSRFTKEED